MSLFSEQIFYCRACGKAMLITVQAPYSYQVCDAKCWKEFEWRRVLSIMGKKYYPQPQDSDGDKQ